MEDGDLLLYADADSTTNADLSALYGLAAGNGESYAPGGIVDGIVSRMALNDGDDSDGGVKDIMKWALSQQEVHLFQFPPNFVEACWTKMDVFLLLNCTDENICMKSAQVDAGFSVWRRGRQSIQFAGQWLGYMEDPRVSTDLPNQLGRPNHACFMDHRHDQSALGLLAKRGGLHMWPHDVVEEVISTTPFPRSGISIMQLYPSSSVRTRYSMPRLLPLTWQAEKEAKADAAKKAAKVAAAGDVSLLFWVL
ncbi:unnamed protein product [Closterium sp. NIES-64]|nr:unnamed protein product [Closterium sp. NIES-64]